MPNSLEPGATGARLRPQSAPAWSKESVALVALGVEEARIAGHLARSFAHPELHVHSVALVGSHPPLLTGIVYRFEKIADCLTELFDRFTGLVILAPVGVVVRSIGKLARDKHRDPAVVVVDAGARYAISLLSGHEGGANALCHLVAELLSAQPVITTTSEARKNLIIGVGCKRGTAAGPIVDSIQLGLDQVAAPLVSVRTLATVECKRNEPGLLEAAERLSLPIRFVRASELRRWSGASSQRVLDAVGAPAVAEPAALFVGARAQCLLPKTVFRPGITIAIAVEHFAWSASDRALQTIALDAPNAPSTKPT